MSLLHPNISPSEQYQNLFSVRPNIYLMQMKMQVNAGQMKMYMNAGQVNRGQIQLT